MRLKEKFKPFVFYVTESFNVAREKDKEKNASECEKIADEFAIEFREFCNERAKLKPLSNIRLSSKELLEIFKKEKEL